VILVAADTPDVSSTQIRRRVQAGESLAGLVPDAVAAYIAAHRLYLGN
jgi:nicotinate-nucleotide adenylyltransferase